MFSRLRILQAVFQGNISWLQPGRTLQLQRQREHVLNPICFACCLVPILRCGNFLLTLCMWQKPLCLVLLSHSYRREASSFIAYYLIFLTAQAYELKP